MKPTMTRHNSHWLNDTTTTKNTTRDIRLRDRVSLKRAVHRIERRFLKADLRNRVEEASVRDDIVPVTHDHMPLATILVRRKGNPNFVEHVFCPNVSWMVADSYDPSEEDGPTLDMDFDLANDEGDDEADHDECDERIAERIGFNNAYGA